MPIRVVDTNQARNRWRDVVDIAHAGEADVVIERYGKPMVVVIPYDDYLAIQEELDELRAARRAAMTYKEWQRNPSLGRPYSEIRSELVAEGRLDE